MTSRILQNYLDHCNSSHELLTQAHSILLQQERNISNILQTQNIPNIQRNSQYINPTNTNTNINTNINNNNSFLRNRNIRSFRDIGDISRLNRNNRYLYTIPLQYNLRNFLSPVTVRPTEQQISNATESILYSTINEPTYTSCPISYEDFNTDSEVLRILHCGHYFEPNSLRTWFRTNVRCPICRYDIRDYTQTTTSTENPLTTNTTTRTTIDENNSERDNEEENVEDNTNTQYTNSNDLIQTFMTSIQNELNNLLQTSDTSNNLISLEFLVE